MQVFLTLSLGFILPLIQFCEVWVDWKTRRTRRGSLHPSETRFSYCEGYLVLQWTVPVCLWQYTSHSCLTTSLFYSQFITASFKKTRDFRRSWLLSKRKRIVRKKCSMSDLSSIRNQVKNSAKLLIALVPQCPHLKNDVEKSSNLGHRSGHTNWLLK
jgi:hypothetical protein